MKTTRIEPDPSKALGDWLVKARRRLSAHEADAGVEARALAGFVLEKTPTWVQTHPEHILSDGQILQLESLLVRLERGEPLPYLTRRQEFYGLEFNVNDAVLIPRPETEVLVERALDWLGDHPLRRTAVDVGAGSGCIAVTLAVRCPDLFLLTVDLSPAALDTARANARKHGVEARMQFREGHLLASQPGPFDLVCANLPYIPSGDVDGLDVAQHEPRLALDGGPDGLALIRELLTQLPTRLSPGGLALLEIEYRQASAVTALARSTFPGAQVRVLADLAGLDRVVEIHLSQD